MSESASNLYARVRDIVRSDEDYEDSVMSRVLLVICGALFIRVGFQMWATLQPGSILAGISVMSLYAGGVQLLIFAVTGLSMQKHGKKVAAGVVVTLTLAISAAIVRGFLGPLATDAIIFSKYSLELIEQGVNPYTQSMHPGLDLPGAMREFSTPRVDGTSVSSLSYPAGAVLAFAPAHVIDIQIRWVAVAAVTAIGALLVWQSPPQLALGGVITLIAGRNLWLTAAGGVFDVLWILPVIVTMALWYREHYVAAAVAMGVACAIKQQPWPMLPFLAIWIWKVSDGPRDFGQRAAKTITAGLATFLAINAPFIASAPGAWLEGVLTPVRGAAPMVFQGLGLTLTTTLDILPMASWWHFVTLFSVTAFLLAAYWLYFDALRWMAFVVPVAIWMVNYRSLVSYWVAFLPIAYYAVLCEWDAARGIGVPSWATLGSADPDVDETATPEVSD